MTSVDAFTGEAVLERLQKVERRIRRRGYVGATALVVATAAVLLAGTARFPRSQARDGAPRQTERIVEAERFVLRALHDGPGREGNRRDQHRRRRRVSADARRQGPPGASNAGTAGRRDAPSRAFRQGRARRRESRRHTERRTDTGSLRSGREATRCVRPGSPRQRGGHASGPSGCAFFADVRRSQRQRHSTSSAVTTAVGMERTYSLVATVCRVAQQEEPR